MADKDFGGAMLGGRKRKSIKEKSRTEHMRSVRDLLGGQSGTPTEHVMKRGIRPVKLFSCFEGKPVFYLTNRIESNSNNDLIERRKLSP